MSMNGNRVMFCIPFRLDRDIGSRRGLSRIWTGTVQGNQIDSVRFQSVLPQKLTGFFPRRMGTYVWGKGFRIAPSFPVLP